MTVPQLMLWFALVCFVAAMGAAVKAARESWLVIAVEFIAAGLALWLIGAHLMPMLITS